MTLQTIFAERGLRALRRLVIDNQLPLMFERSLRLQSGTVESRRVLFTVPVAALTFANLPEVLHICRIMSSPESHQKSIRKFFQAAEFIHFGFECSGDNLIGKCYLELPVQQSDSTAADEHLVFLGFKWSMLNSDLAVVTKYRGQAIPRWSEIQQAMMLGFPVTDLSKTASLLLDCFAPVTHSVDAVPSNLRLLQITEEGSDRISHDLNVYAVERTIACVADGLCEVNREFQGDSNELNAWIQANSTATVGHLAMGLGRDNNPFVTIYHSADINQLS